MTEPINASADPVGGTSIASSLSTIIDRFGSAVFFKPEEVRLLLRQDCPESNREIDLVLATLAHGVPQRLLAAHGDAAVLTLLRESADRLAADATFDRATATWAVRTWAIALALPVADLDRPRQAAASGGALASFASVVTPLAGPRQDDRATVVPLPVAAPVAATKPSIVPVPTPVPPIPIIVRPQPPAPSPAIAPVPEPRQDTVPGETRAFAERAAEPITADAVVAQRPAERSFPLKTVMAGVALIGIALAAWVSMRRPAVVPVASPPIVASAAAPTSAAPPAPDPAPTPVVIAPSAPSSIVATPKEVSEPAATIVAVEPPRRIAPDAPAGKPVNSPVPPAPVAVRPPSIKTPVERRAEVVAVVRPAAPPVPAAATCTRATCGSVVSVRPLDASGTTNELIVRMDDRDIRTVRQSGRWQVGSRVQRVGDDRYVAIRAETAPR